MATTTLVSTWLVKSKLLAGLDHIALRQVRDAAQVRGMAPNENVTVTGGRPDNLFMLQAGRARSFIHTESGSEIDLLWQAPGDIIGLVSLLADPPNYMASAATVTECEFLSGTTARSAGSQKHTPNLPRMASASRCIMSE